MELLMVAPVWLVSDVKASCEELAALFDFQVNPYFQPPGEPIVYGIVERDPIRIHCSRAPDGIARPGRPHKEQHSDAYVFVDDVDAWHEQVVARGGTVLMPPTRQVYAIREMHVGLRDGFVIALGQPA